MILFHRTAAAPWGHMASIIKRSSTGDSLSFGSTPNTVSIRSFVAPLDGMRILVPSITGTQERRTHVLSLKEQDTHTVKFQLAFYLQTHFIYFTLLHKPYQTHFTFTNLIKPISTLQNLTTFTIPNHTLSYTL